MKNLDRIFVIGVIALLGLLSCEEEEIDLKNTSPYFNLQFMHASRDTILGDSIAFLSDSVTNISDSIRSLDSLIEAGDTTDYSEAKRKLNDKRDSVNDNISHYNSIRSILASGEVQVSQIVGVGTTSQPLFFTDSTTNYRLPLNPNADTSMFRVTLTRNDDSGGDITFNIFTSYTRERKIEERKVKVLAYNFQVIRKDDSYDSLSQEQEDSTNFASNDYTAIINF
ncbi:hypothetical protein LVD15_15000 [Fulvivirga maritima]|uniref:hypothetical protein n=1 Tax=Fulvivirga maritima TaxID=2904247 RepID=UPI001F3B43C1|nr:hypothetical protein [Fulvivirga maritima]UII24630.1 hypothetical protein LVD15_15000 [Fulvivirga maritima]